MKLWVTGQYKSGEFPNILWELAGIYDSEDKAVAACAGDSNMFVWSQELNADIPKETHTPPDFKYPVQCQ